MSRPSSRKGSSKKKPPKKTPKKIIAELTELNECLTQQLETLQPEANQLGIKMEAISKKILSSVNKKEFGINDRTDPMQLSTEQILAMLSTLVVKKKVQEMSVEARVEDLETRVTEMSMEIAKMTKKTMAYEIGLQDIMSCSHMDQVKDEVYKLQLIAGEEYHRFTANDPAHVPDLILNGVNERLDNPARRSLENAQKLNLTTPTIALPGETHIKNMNGDLRLYLIKELSLEKTSGADWRMFAERVGIEQETIKYWKSLKLEYPMGRVFLEWGKYPSASVRLLHRHLMSPQLRCTILAKKVSDYYQVE